MKENLHAYTDASGSIFFQNLDRLKAFTYKALETKNDRCDDDALKKMSAIIRNIQRIRKNKKLPQLKFYIKLGLWLVGLTVTVMAFSTLDSISFPALVAMYIGIKLLQLLLRLFFQMLGVLFTLLSILILLAILSVIIF